MLDAETKQRIDAARNILVGKIPNPQSQVEQITIALIYKFMDDMDRESVQMGGKASFFTGDFKKYAWTKMFDPKLGGAETFELYVEAISKISINSNIPKLFRDIFKNAYLPYKDPETLKLFLKTINEFIYDHSEKLGDAFEYLLSILGSQGDAGQFRTPRHIIDFIVSIVDPKKDETVLDPACGTAGFLISAYKHILANNTKKTPGDKLTPTERKQLLTNFSGYDISPDMVRLSLVNLYLHGFVQPQIYEYDTLTSEDRWKEYADVILANPPFMSPSGGIRPHKRFSIPSNRSEVLFVDYIAEHLNPNGRAGIIVPEGIIFQSGTAYKALRKMLVDKYLVAVISLPAGVFNPYSGVKTSILILDSLVAKQAKTIAFFKVENDGFGLGAQRRETEKNDLPLVAKELTAYIVKLGNKNSTNKSKPTLGLIVTKEKIAINGDYNLSLERYREGRPTSTQWESFKIQEVCDTSSGGTPLKNIEGYYKNGTIPWLRSGEVAQGEVFKSELFITNAGLKNSSAKLFPINTVLVAMYGATAGEVGILRFESTTNQAVCGITPGKKVLPDFLYLILKANKKSLIRLAGGGAQPNISQKIIRELEIPVPSLEIQNEIVAEIKAHQKVIDGARTILDNYLPQIPINPTWPMVELGEVCKPEYGFTETALENGDARFVRITDISEEGLLKKDEQKFIKLTSEAKKYLLAKDDVLVARTGATFGKTMIFDENYNAVFASFLIRLRFPKELLNPRYYWAFAQSEFYWNQANALMTGGGQPQFNGNALVKIKFPLPPLKTQEKIVAEIEAEQTLVNSNRELIKRFEKKIQDTINRIWAADDQNTDKA